MSNVDKNVIIGFVLYLDIILIVKEGEKSMADSFNKCSLLFKNDLTLTVIRYRTKTSWSGILQSLQIYFFAYCQRIRRSCVLEHSPAPCGTTFEVTTQKK